MQAPREVPRYLSASSVISSTDHLGLLVCLLLAFHPFSGQNSRKRTKRLTSGLPQIATPQMSSAQTSTGKTLAPEPTPAPRHSTEAQPHHTSPTAPTPPSTAPNPPAQARCSASSTAVPKKDVPPAVPIPPTPTPCTATCTLAWSGTASASGLRASTFARSIHVSSDIVPCRGRRAAIASITLTRSCARTSGSANGIGWGGKGWMRCTGLGEFALELRLRMRS